MAFDSQAIYHDAVTTFQGADSDLMIVLLLFAAVALVAMAYSVRVVLKGRSRYARVEKQGGSSLLSLELMQGGYWFLQPLGRALIFFRVTPNMISWSSFFFGLLTGICFAFGHFGSAACFGAISALLDALDGMVARLTGASSEAGEVLDSVIDRYTEFFMLGGLVVYYRQIPLILILALLALIGAFMVSYSTAKAEALHINPPRGNMRRPERALYLLLGAALSPVTIPWLERVREFPVPLAHPMIVGLGLVALLANVSAIERFGAISRQVREREAELAAARKRVEEREMSRWVR
jgi:CDP-diacylglycerol---glycerol-3-phosphate 3-phosphatidyltransferase